MDMMTLIGAVGGACILLAFFLNEFHKLTTDSIAYNAINLFGAGLLVWYSYSLRSIPFVAINVVWAVLALRDIVVAVKRVA